MMTTPTHAANPAQNDDITVMLVDDSSVIRGALGRILGAVDGVRVVNSVSDGQSAVNIVGGMKPDIIILDIEMPVMDGLTALPKILQSSPQSKVIMFSSLTEKGATVTMEAMRLGAVECLVKPSSGQDVGIGSQFQTQLLDLIRNLVPEKSPKTKPAVTNTTSGGGQMATSTPIIKSGAPIDLRPLHTAYNGKPAILAIGSSTGGPQALFNVLKHCKGLDIPIIITQHMPATFTRILAEHIQQHTGIEAHEGAEGMAIESGKAYVAPGGKHMLFSLADGKLTIKLDDGPQVNFCKPAVDPMYESIIGYYGQKVLGVILTGMGHDGLGGGKILAEKNGRLIAQDEASSVVWGMPGAVASAGICNEVLPLDEIGPKIRHIIMGLTG